VGGMESRGDVKNLHHPLGVMGAKINGYEALYLC